MEAEATEMAWIRDALARHFSVDPAGIRPTSRLREDLRLESLDLVDLVLEIEKRVGRRIENEDLSSVRTVEDVLRLMERLRSSRVG